MTYQDFNHIYYTFTRNKRGVKPYDKLTMTGDELKSFLEHGIKKIHGELNNNQQALNFFYPPSN